MKIFELIQFDFSYALSLAIIRSLWQSLFVMFAITGINRLDCFKSSNRKYTLHVAGLLTLFVLFLINIIITITSPSSLESLGISADIVMANINDYIVESYGNSFSVHEMIAATWVFGVLIFFFKFSIGNLYLRTIKNNGLMIQNQYSSIVHNLSEKLNINQNVRLIKSNMISIPLIVGYVRPIIVFPVSYFTKLTPAQLESIIIHELVHIKRNDYLINQIQSIIECIMFFNPFAWVLSKQIRKYREYYCDDTVQANIEDKKIYLNALYKVAKFSGMAERTSVALFNNKSELVMRVKRMLNQKTEDNTYKPFFSLIIFALMFFGMTAFSSDDISGFETDLKVQVEDFVNKTLELPIVDVKEFLVNKASVSTTRNPLDEKPNHLAMDASNEGHKETEDIPIHINNEIVKPIPTLNSIANVAHSNGDKFSGLDLIMLDTVPNDKNIAELEKRMEEKAKELEEMGVKFEQHYSQNMEIETEKIEELARQLEERYSAKAEEWSKNFENPEMEQKMEELAMQLEKKIEEHMPKFEELNSEEIQGYEKKIEELAQEMEQYIDEDGNVKDEAKIDELHKKIQEESSKLGEIMSDYEIRHSEIFENGEIQELQEQIQAMANEFSAIHINHEEIMDPISVELQAEIEELHKQIQANIKPISEELQKQMQEKAQELSKIALELEKEMRKKKKE